MIFINDSKKQWTDPRLDSLTAVERVSASGWHVLGKEVKMFEAALSNDDVDQVVEAINSWGSQ